MVPVYNVLYLWARGHIVTGGVDGAVVDYDSTSLSEDIYHYKPDPGGIQTLSLTRESLLTAILYAFRNSQICRLRGFEWAYQHGQFGVNGS